MFLVKHCDSLLGPFISPHSLSVTEAEALFLEKLYEVCASSAQNIYFAMNVLFVQRQSHISNRNVRISILFIE